MNFLVRKILGKYFTSDQWANFIVKETAESGRKVFDDSQFQELAKVKYLDKEEQNRIFNEIQVTGIVYSMIFTEQKRKYLNENRANLWREVVEKIPEAFYIWLSELGIESKYIDIWKKLINLRLREYQKGMIEMKNIFRKDLVDEPSERIKEFFYSLQTVALGGALHIARGEIKSNDPLKKHMVAWIRALHTDLAKKIN